MIPLAVLAPGTDFLRPNLPAASKQFIGASGSYFALGQYQARSQEMLQGVLATTSDMQRGLSTSRQTQIGHVELVSGNYFELPGITP